ncbi:MAG: cytochrome C [candidate division Zixibacteria bacterium]|nr:cytochrome C [candidate division Zixibacteria bacterium]
MHQLWAIVSKGDNIPIVIMLFLVAFYVAWALRQAFANDKSIAETAKLPVPDKVHVWPYLVRIEFLGAIAIMVIFTIWSIFINAPLEEPANPNRTPNPSKAPWYFLGLQEMLVYFDPWIAGVVLPSLIIVGLMLIPYIDTNPTGSGYYSFKQRKFAISTYLFGFTILWVSLIFVGTFLRGPGWYFFWPWVTWDPHKVVALTNVNLHEMFGIHSKLIAAFFGMIVVGGYYSLVPLFYFWKKKTIPTLQKMGLVRYAIVSFLFLTMMALPIKMILRWTLNIKYVWVTPWFNV